MVINSIHQKKEEEREYRQSISSPHRSANIPIVNSETKDIAMVETGGVVPHRASFRKTFTGDDNLTRLSVSQRNRTAIPSIRLGGDEETGDTQRDTMTRDTLTRDTLTRDTMTGDEV